MNIEAANRVIFKPILRTYISALIHVAIVDDTGVVNHAVIDNVPDRTQFMSGLKPENLRIWYKHQEVILHD